MGALPWHYRGNTVAVKLGVGAKDSRDWVAWFLLCDRRAGHLGCESRSRFRRKDSDKPQSELIGTNPSAGFIENDRLLG